MKQAKLSLDGWARALAQVPDSLKREILTNAAAEKLDVRRSVLRKVVSDHVKAGLQGEPLIADPVEVLLQQFDDKWQRPYLAKKLGH